MGRLHPTRACVIPHCVVARSAHRGRGGRLPPAPIPQPETEQRCQDHAIDHGWVMSDFTNQRKCTSPPMPMKYNCSRCSRCQLRLPSRRTMAFVEVTASGISTKQVKPRGNKRPLDHVLEHGIEIKILIEPDPRQKVQARVETRTARAYAAPGWIRHLPAGDLAQWRHRERDEPGNRKRPVAGVTINGLNGIGAELVVRGGVQQQRQGNSAQRTTTV